MKVTEHVENLLRQGRKPKELVELGFPKQVVTKVSRQLRSEKIASRSRTQKGEAEAGSHPQSTVTLPAETAPLQSKPGPIESKISQLESRIELLEVAYAERVSREDMEARLDGTPALGLKNRFKCDCGAIGFVALHIQCTKCGKETWWGWFPK